MTAQLRIDAFDWMAPCGCAYTLRNGVLVAYRDCPPHQQRVVNRRPMK